MAHPLQPDPSRGVFETTLVVGGAPRELDAHLARLSASLRELYDAELPAAATGVASERARGLALGWLRLSATPRAGGRPHVEARVGPVERALVLPGWDGALDLRSAPVAGWRGAHKWADRRLLEQLDAQAPHASALLVDPERGALETTRANVFAVGADGILRTPPADGSILPGVTRAVVISLARAAGIEVREQRLEAGDLRAAREAFATGSVRGVEPVRSLDGAAIAGPGAVTAALADALRRRWLG
jgi:para-aminobenzoate synthetase/4-amino-4-deoxychorismate lyase